MIKVICGNTLSVLEDRGQIEKESIDTIFTAPSPFGYYENNPEKIGGDPNITKYIENLIEVVRACETVLKPTGNLFIQLGDQFTPRGDLLGIPTYFEMMMRGVMLLNDRIIWHRTETGPRKKYNERGFLKNYEFIFHFVKGFNFYFNTNSKYNKTSVFSYPLEDSYYTNEFDSGLPSELTKMIIDTTVPANGGTILDPLAGSGKVGVVAKKMNRNAILIDIDPSICELMRIRLGIS